MLYAAAAIGIRERDRTAAIAAFAVFTLGLIGNLRSSVAGALQGTFAFGGILNYFIAALLLANVRATWIASTSLRDQDFGSERLSETLVDKFSDQLPGRVWPVLRFVFAMAAVLFVAVLFVALLLIAQLRLRTCWRQRLKFRVSGSIRCVLPALPPCVRS